MPHTLENWTITSLVSTAMVRTTATWLAISMAFTIQAFCPKVASAADEVHNVALNRAVYASSSADFINTGHMATDGQMTTQWLSKKGEAPWMYVDLGAECAISKVVPKWNEAYAKRYKIQISTDTGPSPVTGLVEHWSDVFTATQGKGGVEEISFPLVKARYVRLWLRGQDSPQGVSLAEFEVFGKGGPARKPAPLPPPAKDGTWNLCGGWKLCSESFVKDDAATVSTSGYDDAQWLPAIVPGTVLTSYQDAGAVPDMYYGDQQFQVSDWFCRCNWWYRTEARLPESYRGKRIWLNFDGINHRADVFVNGSSVGEIAGAFLRGRFDITDHVVSGQTNAIAVRIHPMPKPMEPLAKKLDKHLFNDGFTVNTPTFVESAGWDWLPTIRDRNIGIWNRVFLDTSGDVTIVDPWVVTDLPLLPDTSRADLTVKTELKNSSDRKLGGTLRGTIGDIKFDRRVTIGAGETLAVSIDKSSHSSLSIHNPKLWWPNGWGEPHLYDFTLRFESDDGGVSDTKTAKIGIRKVTRSKGGPLTFFFNGQKILVKGSNWGMDEGMLRCDRAGYEARLRMEKGMNFNMVRNCLGAVHKEDFFDLCDELGLMVWEEFGINHPIEPLDPEMFLENARDRFRVRRIHPCVVIWCTANERGPREPILSAMPKLAAELDGSRPYLQHSTLKPFAEGDGPYSTHGPTYYAQLARGWRTEVGSPAVPPIESMKRIMPHEKLWPINETWATFDWVNAGETAFWCGRTEKAIAAFGEPVSIEDFCRKAQMVSMETFKAIYEAWNDKMWNNCSGVMIWMSNPCWPSLLFNTYDYYLEPTAAYFGCRKACEPIHVQWSMASNEVKAVNATLKDLTGLTADARLYNLDGSERLRKSAKLDCPANSAHKCFDLFDVETERDAAVERGLSSVYFIKLELKDSKGRLLSDNFYWQGKAPGVYQDLSGMDRVKVTGTAECAQDGDACRAEVAIDNPNKGLAVMTRLKLLDEASGLLVAPIMYSDNYFSLVPGESKAVTVEFSAKSVSGNRVSVWVEGWNVEPAKLNQLQIKRPVTASN